MFVNKYIFVINVIVYIYICICIIYIGMYENYFKILFKEAGRVGKRKIIIHKPPYNPSLQFIMYVRE